MQFGICTIFIVKVFFDPSSLLLFLQHATPASENAILPRDGIKLKWMYLFVFLVFSFSNLFGAMTISLIYFQMSSV